jgi:predicted DNA-binding transcriptional regulator YafY
MKPLGFSVEEMVEVLSALDALEGRTLDAQARQALAVQLDSYCERVQTQAEDLLAKAARGRELGQHLRELADQHR